MKAVLFDLGGTLVHYFHNDEWPQVLDRCLEEVRGYLCSQGAEIDRKTVRERAARERRAVGDLAVLPLAGRLRRVFGIEEQDQGMCRAFMRPLFSLARVYDDTFPVLRALRAKGLRTAVVSNTPWGSPGYLWREELSRLGLLPYLDAAVFCDDVGWRKPDERIYRYALRCLDMEASDCLFVGDDVEWDVRGPRSIGMNAILLARDGRGEGKDRIPSLHHLLGRLPADGHSIRY